MIWILQLSDVPAGGLTVFTEIGAKVKPTKVSLMIFFVAYLFLFLPPWRLPSLYWLRDSHNNRRNDCFIIILAYSLRCNSIPDFRLMENNSVIPWSLIGGFPFLQILYREMLFQTRSNTMRKPIWVENGIWEAWFVYWGKVAENLSHLVLPKFLFIQKFQVLVGLSRANLKQ